MTEAPWRMARHRGTRGLGRFSDAPRLTPVTALAVILVAGLLVRAVIAALVVPDSGFRIDIGDFTAWALRLNSVGPGAFYEKGFFTDYPPGYLYLLWAIGAVGGGATAGLVKVPGVLADVGAGALLFILCRRFLADTVGASRAAWVGVAAAALFVFNPGTIFDSAVWGQMDSVGTLVVLAALYALARGWTEVAAVGAVVALLIKFQFAFLIPIIAVVGIKRHVFGRSTDLAHAGRPDGLRVLTSLAAGLGSLVALIYPFRMTIWAPGSPCDPTRNLICKFVEAANTYQGLSINAFNLWRNPWSGLGNTLQWGNDQAIAFSLRGFAVSWQTIGVALFAAAAVTALWIALRRDDLVGLLLAALVLAVAFFAFPTRVHERYLFPAMALAAPLAVMAGRWALAYGALSIAFFANVYWVYTADWSFAGPSVLNPGIGGRPMARDPLLGATLLSDAGIYLLSLGVVALAAWLIVEAMRTARLTPRRVVEGVGPPAAERMPPPAVEPKPLALSVEAQRPPLGPRWLRPDPADPYLHERGRSVGRLDLAVMAGLVVVAFGFRVWNLDIPRSMHFDEAYHARSAAEWLSDWEHGWKRDVYEWTHPMLAKYLIAAGIVLSGPNKVVASTPLSAPAPSLTVAVRRSSIGVPRSIVFVGSDGAQIAARDSLTGEVAATWSAPGPVAALTYDADRQRLLVGLAGSGQVAVYDLRRFLTVTGPRPPPPAATPIASGLSGVEQILAVSGEPTIVMRGPDGIAAADAASGAPRGRSNLHAAAIGYTRALGGTGAGGTAQVVATDPQRSALIVLAADSLVERSSVALPVPPIGPLVVQGEGADQQVFVPVGALPANREHPAVDGGLSVVAVQGNSLVDTVPLPGRPVAIAWQPVANIVYIAGRDAVWTVEPHGTAAPASAGYAVFATTPIPGPALAMAVDASDNAQADDNSRLLVSTAAAAGAGPQLVAIDAGSNAFAWRIAGVAFGSLLAGLMYWLGVTLFTRRRIAVLAALFVAFDGMSYVMSRIAMNDIYTAVFIVAAYVVFWQIWGGRWTRSAWWALPLVGVLIGLAAASKWVGFYALAGLWVLVLARSHLGRLALVALSAFLALVAGLGAPWPFTAVMLLSLALALVLVYLRPIRLGSGDLMALPATGLVLGGVGLAFAIAYGQVPGRQPTSAVEFVFAFLFRGAQAAWPGWLMLAVAAALIGARAVASLRHPDSDARWHQPGELGAFAWPWIGACLVVVPFLVYFLTYIPYLQLGHSIALAGQGPGYGWSLDELHAQMFGYHFGLQAGHPAASPWWSWPLDLKPVWFFGHNYDERQVAVIYNGGNPVLFWAGIPAILYVAAQAWRRRSAGLVLIVVAFAFQLLPWTRIERATFQYHYFTAALFAMVAVAYLIDDLLRHRFLREAGIALLVAAVIAGVLIFPLGSAIPMPDWYITAARALPPWNYAFQFPGPPQGSRGQLVSASAVELGISLLLAVGAVVFALFGRDWLDRWRALTARARDA